MNEFEVIKFGSEVLYQRTFGLYLDKLEHISTKNVVNNLIKYYDSFSLMDMEIHTETANILNLIKKSKISIISGHGNPEGIIINGMTKNKLYNYDIYYPYNGIVNRFSNVDIIIFAGCSTAGSYTNPTALSHINLAESAFMSGATVSIGWDKNTFNNDMHRWIEIFLNFMAQGETAGEALDKTNKLQYIDLMPIYDSYVSIKTAVLYGDRNYKLN